MVGQVGFEPTSLAGSSLLRRGRLPIAPLSGGAPRRIRTDKGRASKTRSCTNLH